jgi:hypothetical protein
MVTAFLVALRCASDDIPLFLLQDERSAGDLASAITPAKAWAIIKASNWSSYSQPIAVVVVAFQDGVVVGERQSIDCEAADWKWPSDTSDSSVANTRPPFIRWLERQGIGRPQHLGGNSWSVTSLD